MKAVRKLQVLGTTSTVLERMPW